MLVIYYLLTGIALAFVEATPVRSRAPPDGHVTGHTPVVGDARHVPAQSLSVSRDVLAIGRAA